MRYNMIFLGCLLLMTPSVLQAQFLQATDTSYQKQERMTGHLWGYTFGDYYYKTHRDKLDRGGDNEFTGIAKNDNAFDIRRVYLGYDFNIDENFSTELLVAAENWDVDNKLSPFIKYANVQWHSIFEGSTLIVGLSATPSFRMSEKLWGYRSIERTILDNRGAPSYDLGIALKGTFDQAENFGYHVMVGNGTSAKADNDKFRKFYGRVYGRFFDKRLTVSLYADYTRFRWQKDLHRSATTTKLFVGYSDEKFKIGAEAFMRSGQNDVARTSLMRRDTINTNSFGWSLFVNGDIIPKKLGFFARTDLIDPYLAYKTGPTYQGLSENYNPNTKEHFITAGLDFSPIENVHFMPNIWYTGYRGQANNLKGAERRDYDLVYRLTFYYVFGR